MTLRQYLSIMIVASLLCWVSWIVVLLNVDPFTSGWVGFLFFYISLFFSLLGTSAVLIFVLYYQFSRRAVPMYRYVQCSFRDALMLAVTGVGLLYLQGQRYLRWWNFIILFLFLLCIGIFVQLRKRGQLSPSR